MDIFCLGERKHWRITAKNIKYLSTYLSTVWTNKQGFMAFDVKLVQFYNTVKLLHIFKFNTDEGQISYINTSMYIVTTWCHTNIVI